MLIFMMWGLVTHRSFCVVGNKTKPPLLNGLPSSQFRDQEGLSQVHSCLVWFKLFVNAARFSLKTNFVVLHPHKELAFLMFGAYYPFWQFLCSPKKTSAKQAPLVVTSAGQILSMVWNILVSYTTQKHKFMLREPQSLHDGIIIPCKAVGNCQIHFIYIEVWEKHN